MMEDVDQLFGTLPVIIDCSFGSSFFWKGMIK